MSYVAQEKSTAPAAPGGNKSTLYPDENGVWNAKDSTGVNTVISGRALYNWLDNSNFAITQRSQGSVLATYSSIGGRVFSSADRWSISNETASVQFIRTDTVNAPEAGLNSRYYGNFTQITGPGKFVVSQALIATNADNLRGRTVRVQVKLKSILAAAATWRIGLVQLTSAGVVDVIPSGAGTFITAYGAATVDPTLGANLAYIAPKAGTVGDNCTIDGNAADCAVTSAAWQQFGMLFDVPTTAKNLIVMVWSDSQVAVTNGISISEVSLTDGYEVQAWSPTDFATELFRCLPYVTKTFNLDTTPVSAAGVNTGNLDCIAGKAGATALGAQFQWRYPSRMRAVPTITLYNPVVAGAEVRNVPQAANCTATASLATAEMVRITATGTGGGTATVIGDQMSIHVFADADF